jgi:hypothetical protein
MTDATALAISLLRKHADRSARGSVALIRSLRAEYEKVSDAALHASVEQTLLALADYLENHDDAAVFDLVEGIINARQASGLVALDFAVMSHCYMPPLRQVFVDAVGPVDGLAAYDVVEGISLPLMEKLLRVAVKPYAGAFITPMAVRSIVLGAWTGLAPTSY